MTRQLHILSVCSDRLLLHSRTMLLDADGYGIVEAASCAQALSALQLSEFDLIMLDYALPEADARKIIAVAKKGTSALPVIMLTPIQCSVPEEGVYPVDSLDPKALLDIVSAVASLVQKRTRRA